MKRLDRIFKIVMVLTILFIGFSATAQEAAVTQSPEIDRPIYEELGMTPTQLFSIMAIFTAILVGFVISIAGSTKNILAFKKEKLNDGKKMILLLVGLGISSIASATESTTGATEYVFPFPDEAFWAFLTLDIILVMVILYLTGIMKGVLSEYKVPAKINIFAKWKKTITDVVPVEEEGSILMDHDYDGIKELDNNLPPWWKWGFYITILWAVGYLFYYQVFQIGNLQEAEYLAEMEEGDRSVAEYKDAHPELINAENVTLLTDQASISKGREIFITNCQTCHMEKGMGGTGPNLTDDHWIYSGEIKGIFNTVSEGTANGMTSWKNFLTGADIQAVASYVLQLDYISPPTGKLPEGNVIVE